MNMSELEIALAAADPVDQDRLDGLDLEAMEAELLADLDGEQPAVADVSRPRRHHHRRLVVAVVSAAVAVAAAILIFAGGASERPSPAYGADLVRFAEASPLLLLEGPDWRVQHVSEYKTSEGTEGSMEFVTGKPIPYESIKVGGTRRRPRESGMFPPAVRQRRVDLAWRHTSLKETIAWIYGLPHPHGRKVVRLPVLNTTAYVDTRNEFYVNQGGPGNRQMIALWSEDGLVLELRAAVADQATFEERLDWLHKVDSQTWLEAMPAAVVKAADFHGTVREMVKGIPLPRTFAISRVPDEGLTTNREQIGSKVAGTVSCLWLRQWAEARNSGDTAAEQQAVGAMATSRHWKILTEVEATNGYSPLVWEIADAMKKGYWEWNGHKRKLLPYAEGLGCARLGLPLMAKKIERQREHGVPPPP